MPHTMNWMTSFAGPSWRGEHRFLRIICLALLLPNLCFLTVAYLARSLPVQPIRESISLALDRGDILTQTKDFVFLDSARGVEPYGDSSIMRMALYRGDSKWRDTIAPRSLKAADDVVRHPAEELSGAVFGTLQFDPNSGYIHRYWFGNMAVTSFLLFVFDVRQARLVLMNSSYLLFLLMALAAARVSKRVLTMTGFLAAFGILFSSLPYHGQTFGYAPAFIWSQMTAVAVLLFWRRLPRLGFLIPFTMVLGGVAAYLEPMSGAFCIGSSWVFLLTYLSVAETMTCRTAFQLAALATAGFLVGFLASVLFKQALVMVVFGWDQTIPVFLAELRWRMSSTGPSGESLTVLKSLKQVIDSTPYLTFGSSGLAKLLDYGSAFAFASGLTGAVADLLRSRARGQEWGERLFQYLAVLAPMGIIMAWFALLPNHNFIHAWITVRLLFIPLGMAWLLLYWAVQNLFFRETTPAVVAAGLTTAGRPATLTPDALVAGDAARTRHGT